MTDGGIKDIHPDLAKAQENAQRIQNEGFEDFGAKTADIRVDRIVQGLASDDKDDRDEALEDIQRFKDDWSSRIGAGTAGAILTRLIARGIIDDFPETNGQENPSQAGLNRLSRALEKSRKK